LEREACELRVLKKGEIILTAHNLLSEALLSFSQLANRLPAHRGKGRCCPATVWRWVSKGVRLSSGEILKLEAIRVAGRWLSTVEALDRFVDAQTEVRLGAAAANRREPRPVRPQVRTPGQRKRANERAARALAKAGI
jgi:hypothetical protein